MFKFLNNLSGTLQVRWDLEPGWELEVYSWADFDRDNTTSFAIGNWSGTRQTYSYPASVTKETNLINIHNYQRPKEWDSYPDWYFIQGTLEICKGCSGVPEKTFWHYESGGEPIELEQGCDWKFFESLTPTHASSRRRRKLVSQVERPEQEIIRRMLLATTGICAISGCGIEACLEAAHLVPVANGGIEVLDNMILLRSDLHRLFDAGLISLNFQTETLVVCADPSVMEHVKASFQPGLKNRHRDYSATQCWLDERNKLQPRPNHRPVK
jgi:hypothetical protein